MAKASSIQITSPHGLPSTLLPSPRPRKISGGHGAQEHGLLAHLDRSGDLKGRLVKNSRESLEVSSPSCQVSHSLCGRN